MGSGGVGALVQSSPCLLVVGPAVGPAGVRWPDRWVVWLLLEDDKLADTGPAGRRGAS